MTFSRLVLFVVLVSSTTVSGAPSPEPAASFAPIGFLVGGVWRGDLPAAANGAKMSIEMRCDWASNHQGIHFDSTFISNEKRMPYASGAYYWNGAKQQLVFVYSDAEGSLTEGAVFPENNALRHEFTVTDAHGKVEKARAVITPDLPDQYTNDIFVEKDGSWQKVASVVYRRRPG